jgi:bifunctional non-homologous end joining protein LigD
MGLQTYGDKRDFRITPEPPPEKHPRKSGHSFCVQKHDATRLHYDFRLELDGVLLSWAVTKGPSIDPADKRLAVRTEDHPLAYGKFEGIIPQGQYGGGTVMLWDEGSWKPHGDPHEGLKKGHLSFELRGQRMQGNWALIRMRKIKEHDKNENWLLIKERDDKAAPDGAAQKFLEQNATSIKTGATMDEIAARAGKVWQSKPATQHLHKQSPQKADPAAAQALLSRFRQPQLATLVSEPPTGKDWIHEIKFDGYRILCGISKHGVAIRTRNGNDWTAKFPAIAQSLAALDIKDAVLDGEAVMLDKEGRSSFQSLQQALGDGGDPSAIQGYFFDILHLDGKDLTAKPLTDRKKMLEKLFKKIPASSSLRYSEHLEGAAEILKRACAMGLEGVVSKRKNASYFRGRSRDWLKSKCNKRQEFVIIGFTRAKNDYRAIGALHIAYTSEGDLVYAGKVGTGFTHSMAEQIYKRLEPLTLKEPKTKGISTPSMKGAVWVKPEVLCEVSFTEWTETGHVRHPSFEGLREDKKPAEVTKELPIKTPSVLSRYRQYRDKNEWKVRDVLISHPDRVIFEKELITKGQLAEYYGAVAPLMIKQIGGHPISLLRCPSGVDAECFFQRNPDRYMRTVVKPFSWAHKGTKHEYLYVEDVKGIVFLVQMGVIEFHPWGAPAARIDYPDRLVFDLDPDEGIDFEAVKLAARDVRARLTAKGLKSYVKCTGGKGLHVVAPLEGKRKWPEVKAFTAAIAADMVKAAPEAYVATMTKAKRKGKIFVDYFRNDYTATAIADYSVRARPGAPVAVPLHWDELDDLKSAHDFSINDVLERIDHAKPIKPS